MLNREELRELFEYDESSPSCLRWRKNGKQFGYFTKNGGCQGNLNGKVYMVNQVIYHYHHGDIKEGDGVYFIDNDKSNLKIDNLVRFSKSYRLWCNHVCENHPFTDIFYLDQYGNVRWKVDRFHGEGSRIWCSEKDSIVKATKTSQGYLKVNVKSNYYQCKDFSLHRLIAILTFGDISTSYEIDHINGDRKDNSLANLRVVDRATNARNSSMSKRNSTGFVGVTFDKNRNRYISRWRDSEGNKSKCFRVDKYGEHKAFELACEYRTKMIQKLNDTYRQNGYTERHGK